MQMIAQEDALQIMEEPKIKKHIPMAQAVKSPNIAQDLSAEDLTAFGKWVVCNYKKDVQSRREWEERNAEAIKLALQMKEVKSFPWTNCANVKFPLLTIAALQFLARISILTKGRSLVKLDVIGQDPEGKKGLRAKRIAAHLSLQLTDDDVNWADEDEKAKLSAAILGSAFKKTSFDILAGIPITEFVPAMDFVMDYHTKHVETANRATHRLSMNLNKIREREVAGMFLKMQATAPAAADQSTNLLEEAAKDTSGMRPSAQGEEYAVLEQHCWYDFDGDGIAEPYIFFVRHDTEQVLRIVARYLDQGDVFRRGDHARRAAEQDLQKLKSFSTPDLKSESIVEQKIQSVIDDPQNKVLRIVPTQYFTQYTFIPSPDGGCYGYGLGALLGPVNAAVDSAINQMLDAGTMSNTAGGFLGRGVKLKGGKTSFDPFEWKPADTTGDDLRKNIFPLPVREPSAVMFQLLGLLIQYGERISGATDIMSGVNPGQNTPAETARTTVEQGMMLFSGIYARMYRAFRTELKLRYSLNQLYLDTSPQFFELTEGEDAIIAADDYTKGKFRIFPTADASSVSMQQRKQKAMELMQLANGAPGFDKYEATKRYLEAAEYEDIDTVYPDPKGQRAIAPPVPEKIQIEQMRQKQAQQEHADTMQLEIARLRSDAQLIEAKVEELSAKATMELASADGVDTGHQIALIEAQLGAANQRKEELHKSLDLMLRTHAMMLQHKQHEDNMDLAHEQLAVQKTAAQQKQQQGASA